MHANALRRAVPLPALLIVLAAAWYWAFVFWSGAAAHLSALRWSTNDAWTFRLYGDWLFGRTPFDTVWYQVSLRTFMYPLFLEAGERLGRSGVEILQFLLWLAITPLVFLICRRAAQGTAGAVVGWALFASALSPIVFTLHARSEVLLMFWATAGLACLCGGRLLRGRGPRLAAAAWCLSLATVTKPAFLPIALALVAYGSILLGRSRWTIAILGSMLPIALQVLINLQLFGIPMVSAVGPYTMDAYFLAQVDEVLAGGHEPLEAALDRAMKQRRNQHLWSQFRDGFDRAALQRFLDHVGPEERSYLREHPGAVLRAYGQNLRGLASLDVGDRYLPSTTPSVRGVLALTRLQGRLFLGALLAGLVVLGGRTAAAGRSWKAALRERWVMAVALGLALYIYAVHAVVYAEADRYAALAYPFAAVVAASLFARSRRAS